MRQCFIICAFGADGSKVRTWSEDVFHHLLTPVAHEFEYEIYRVLDNSAPGEITPRVIEELHKADLVIADLSFHNPNVFYELGIRHSTGLPYIHVCKGTSDLLFDVSPIHTV